MFDLTEQNLGQFYDTLARENQKLLNELKSDCEPQKEKEITKQLPLINNLMINVLKLKNYRKKLL